MLFVYACVCVCDSSCGSSVSHSTTESQKQIFARNLRVLLAAKNLVKRQLFSSFFWSIDRRMNWFLAPKLWRSQIMKQCPVWFASKIFGCRLAPAGRNWLLETVTIPSALLNVQKPWYSCHWCLLSERVPGPLYETTPWKINCILAPPCSWSKEG